MKYRLLVIVAVMTLVGSGLAQSSYLHANIPFQFVADGIMMPGGAYRVERTDQPGLLLLAGPSQTILVNTNAAESVNGAPASELVFEQYGGKYYLAQIWCEGNEEGYAVPINRKKLSVVAEKGPTVQIAAAK